MAALLALGGAACWGVGDFLGGLASRRMAGHRRARDLAGDRPRRACCVWVLVVRRSLPGRRSSCCRPRRPASPGSSAWPRCTAGSRSAPWVSSRRSPRRRLSWALTADAVQGTFPAALQWLGIALVLAGIAALSLASRRTAGAAASRAGSGSHSSRRSGSGSSSSGSTQDRTRARRGRSSPLGRVGVARRRSRHSSCRRRCARPAARGRSSIGVGVGDTARERPRRRSPRREGAVGHRRRAERDVPDRDRPARAALSRRAADDAEARRRRRRDRGRGARRRRLKEARRSRGKQAAVSEIEQPRPQQDPGPSRASTSGS